MRCERKMWISGRKEQGTPSPIRPYCLIGPEVMATDCLDRANCYGGLGDIAPKQKVYDKALVNYLQQLEIVARLGDQVNIALTLKSVGKVYGNKKLP
ncbi:unnamed protein product [Didymodactylos carnosus]|uniref:Uncharacterized protein n=1 Tax=Didymodactylos carnosus TaxID=1234261 RepID=A0A816FHH3_9BILA|nr:unnamed protein product [Didymodactylos carnosus]CAF4610596.1 unnamed protein product [Didymodactylos carnosus]